MAQLPVTAARRTRDLTDAGIAKARLAAQRLAAPAVTEPARLVAWLGAVQSQDYPLGKWSLAQRLAKTSGDIDAAIADGSILRTHVLRPTWHFVARDDVRWMQELTAPRVLALLKQNDRRNGVDAALVERGMKAIEAAITRGGHLTRRDVDAALGRAGIHTDPWLLGDLLMHAELRAIVCSGVPRDRHQTYALVDERAPKASSMTRDEALSTLARRYFTSHGPATARDFQWWSGLTAADVARSLDILGRAFERVSSGDRAYIFPVTGAVARSRAGTAHVLQPFDDLHRAIRKFADFRFPLVLHGRRGDDEDFSHPPLAGQ